MRAVAGFEEGTGVKLKGSDDPEDEGMVYEVVQRNQLNNKPVKVRVKWMNEKLSTVYVSDLEETCGSIRRAVSSLLVE